MIFLIVTANYKRNMEYVHLSERTVHAQNFKSSVTATMKRRSSRLKQTLCLLHVLENWFKLALPPIQLVECLRLCSFIQPVLLLPATLDQGASIVQPCLRRCEEMSHFNNKTIFGSRFNHLWRRSDSLQQHFRFYKPNFKRRDFPQRQTSGPYFSRLCPSALVPPELLQVLRSQLLLESWLPAMGTHSPGMWTTITIYYRISKTISDPKFSVQRAVGKCDQTDCLAEPHKSIILTSNTAKKLPNFRQKTLQVC